MALLTKRVIMITFQQMREEMPFDKVTVSALVRRCQISSNTFYYHYQDIYALLDVWCRTAIGRFVYDENGNLADWKDATKQMLRACKTHPAIIYHIFNSLSRDAAERFIFTLTDDIFSHMIQLADENHVLSDGRLREMSAFCRYAYIGFFMQFIWNRMSNDIDESVDRLAVLFETFVAACIRQDAAAQA